VLAGVVVLSIALDDGNARRDAVGDYIRDVNRIEVRNASGLRRANEAYRRLSFAADAPARQDRDLAQAETMLGGLRRDLAALAPPPDGVPLDRKLLKLVDAQLAFTRDVRALARYLPELERRQRGFALASRRLSSDLDTRRGDADAAEAFTRYAKAVRAAAQRIAVLEAPAFVRAKQRERVADMRTMARIAGRVAAGLRAGDAFEAERASRDLARAAAGLADAAATQRVVVGEYNRRLRALGALRRDVDRERDRLDATLDG